jgi:hypothetical protein
MACVCGRKQQHVRGLIGRVELASNVMPAVES